MGPAAAGITASLAVIAYVGFVGGAVNFFFPESAAPEAMDSSSPESPVAALSFPLPYSATVTQSGDGIAEPRTRFYISPSIKAAIR